MQILAHRGYWNKIIPPNSEEALSMALKMGYGFESDIRDYKGELVVSHNIADNTSLPVNELFSALAEYDNKFCFAINIKADGLQDELFDLVEKYKIINYFAFDMSVPQMIEYCKKGLNYFTRQSEYEKTPVLYEKASGVWIDGFEGTDWINEDIISSHISNGKTICIVSPELHGRSHLAFWERLILFKTDFSKIMLCTDMPDKASEFFKDFN